MSPTRRRAPPLHLLAALQERAKELNCLYEVEELLKQPDVELDDALDRVARLIPSGWQHPSICEAEIELHGRFHRSGDFAPGEDLLEAEIVVQDLPVGAVRVFYIRESPDQDVGPFLKEEARLVRSIAERLSNHVLYHQLREARDDWERASSQLGAGDTARWRAAIHLLRRSDRDLYLRITRKLLNHLFGRGIEEAAAWRRQRDPVQVGGEVNSPGRLTETDDSWLLTDGPFELAARNMPEGELLACIQRWMVQDRASFFTKEIHSSRSSLTEIADALRRYHHVIDEGDVLPQHATRGLRVALIRRLLTEQLDFIMVAKEFIGTRSIEGLLERVVMPAGGNGKIGGKAAGLVLADSILRRSPESRGLGVKVPLTWFIASSGMRQFIAWNDMEEVVEQKYKTIDEVRHDYPNIIRLFKSSPFPPEIVKGVSVALDEFEDRPLIVRSSSLLEDRAGTAFSGKYKSLFLANQGTKRQRTSALLDAVAEVYASTFGPDPVEYRREHGLLDFDEEMGVLIQEVVGTRVGRYFLPAFAGVAFSHNEFRWSPRIRREDGLVRIVPGLGSRAVDRVADDYPTLAVPGQPNLRVNTSVDEVVRYAPRQADVIDLQEGGFATVAVADLLRECGTDYPAFVRVFSVLKDGLLRKPTPLLVDPESDELIVTFAELFESTSFLPSMATIMNVLQETLGRPVDVEFAHDGEDLYLLQCRAQSNTDDCAPAPIPREVPPRDVIFTADRHVSNGWLPDLTHLVYVDPLRYAALGSRADLLAVGRAVGELNKLLPKRRFALLGPGRWGSRGDIKLGVSVTYSDINNTALLVEIARRKGNYVPDLSFGTHFFQDLVEARIRYLPLHPDEGTVFAEGFLARSPNLLGDLLPDFRHLDDVVRVIDVAAVSDGRVLRVLMNADLDEAMALLIDPDQPSEEPHAQPQVPYHRARDEFWRWRMKMAERLASEIEPDRWGVVGVYVFGSAKNATAGPCSDIDLLVHTRGADEQRRRLEVWLDGWSRSLAWMNHARTGYKCDGLLDVHWVTDEDIEARTSWAMKIGAVTDAARPLQLGGARGDDA
jgi:pyruvate, water dikinase